MATLRMDELELMGVNLHGLTPSKRLRTEWCLAYLTSLLLPATACDNARPLGAGHRMQHLSRRTWVKRSGVAILTASVKMNHGIAQTPQQSAAAGGQPLTLLDHPRGQYRFLLGLPAYSAGVIAANDYEIVRATFSQPVPLDAAFRAIDKH